MVGCTDYSEDIQNLGTEVNDKIESLDKKIEDLKADLAATYATKAALEEVADEVAAVNDAVDAVEAALATKADKAEVEAAISAANAAIEELQTALATKADKSYVDDQLANVNALIEKLDADLKELSEDLTDTNNKLAGVSADLAALTTKVETYKTELQNSIDAVEDRLDKAVADLEAADDELKKQIEDEVTKLDGKINTVAADLASYKLATDAAIKALQESKADKSYVDAEVKKLNDEITKVDAALKDLESKVDAAIADYKAAVEEAKKIVEEINARLTLLESDVESLLNRVQSMVYVPDYDDHKATIDWAVLTVADAQEADSEVVEENDGFIIGKKSVLRYRVYAAAGESAAKAAGDIAKAWLTKNVTLGYEIEEVATRADEDVEPATLEIVGVEVDTENPENADYLYVTVIAKNFKDEFFLENENIYSAALVLTRDMDGNNRSSEYTNLRRGDRDDIALVIKTTDTEGEEVTLKGDAEFVYEIPSSDCDTVVTAYVGAPYYEINNETLSATALEEKYGYAIDAQLVTSIVSSDRMEDLAFSQGDTISYNDETYNVDPAAPAVDNNVNLLPVAEGESYSERVGDYMYVTYAYTVGTETINVTYKVLITKELIYFDLATELEWTAQFADTYDEDNDGKYDNYTWNDVPYTAKYAADSDILTNLASYINGAKHISTVTSVYDPETNTWAADNNFWVGLPKYGDKVVDVVLHNATNSQYEFGNKYRVVWTYETETSRSITTLVITLAELPVYNVVAEKEDFVLQGKEGWFTAPVTKPNILELAYAAIAKADGFGYEADADRKASFDAAFANADKDKSDIKVNTKDGIASNIFLTADSEARLNPNQVVEGLNEVTAKYEPWAGVIVNFAVKGNVVLPASSLYYSTEYVVGEAPAGVVTMVGEVSKETGIFTVETADLGKYFNVAIPADEADKEYTVVYTVVTENAPVPEENTVNVTYNPELTDGTVQGYGICDREISVINWGSYDGNEIDVTAQLYVNGLVLGDPVPVKLVVADPLVLEEAGQTVETSIIRLANKETLVPVYENLHLYRLDAEGNKIGENLIDTEATSLSEVFAKSGADVKYGAKVNAVLDNVYYIETSTGNKVDYSNKKYTFDQTTGILTLHKDSGVLTEDIIADVVVNVEHVLHMDPAKTVTVRLVFKNDENNIGYKLANGGTIVLDSDLNLSEPLEIDDPDVTVTLDLNGYTIKSVYDDPNYSAAIMVRNGKLIINDSKGTGVVNGGGNIAVWAGRGDAANAGEIYIHGGTFTTADDSECIYAINKGKVFIDGGTFSTGAVSVGSFAEPQHAVLNLNNNGELGAKIVVSGGFFKNFNPADNVSENAAWREANPNQFVAEGYKAVLAPNSSTDYVVVAE